MAFFITFEGIDGCGKTTQLQAVSAWLSRHNIAHICTREPGGTTFAEAIRKLLLNHTSAANLSPLTQALCMTAARIEHVKHIILPALQAKKWVLCDRFTDSTTVYQGYAENVPLSFIETLHKTVPVRPHCTFIFTLPPSAAQERLSARKGKAENADLNHMDTKPSSFYEKATKGFQVIAARDPNRCVTIDGSDAPHTITEKVITTLKRKLAIS